MRVLREGSFHHNWTKLTPDVTVNLADGESIETAFLDWEMNHEATS